MDWTQLLELADQGSLARGHDYARRGLIRIESATSRRVHAQARGTTTYDVVLEATHWSCTCPMGLRDLFCKHLVATALVAAADDGVEEVAEDGEPAADAQPAAPIVDWLTELDRDGLAAVVDALLESSPRNLDVLEALRARATGDLSPLRAAVDSLKTRRHLDWRAADRHGEDAHRVADELERSLSPSTAADLVPLLEAAIDTMVRVISRSDDSSGIQGSATGRFLDLHAAAVDLAPPDPGQLAAWMVRCTFDPSGFLAPDPVRYAAALGERGRVAYVRALDRAMAKRPDDYEYQHALLRLAILDRDAEAIVRLAGGPLDNAGRYAHVVEALLEAGQQEEALRLAVEGTRMRPIFHITPNLYDTAVRILRDRGDEDEVLRLRREQLQQMPTETSYASLRRAATATKSWPVERLAALDTMLEQNPRAWMNVLLDEGETDLVWNASADLPLDTAMLVRLVRERAKTHPSDVWDRYVLLVQETLRVADQQNYRQAVVYLGELRRACAASGESERFTAYVAELLEQHRRRPTLVPLLERLLR